MYKSRRRTAQSQVVAIVSLILLSFPVIEAKRPPKQVSEQPQAVKEVKPEIRHRSMIGRTIFGFTLGSLGSGDFKGRNYIASVQGKTNGGAMAGIFFDVPVKEWLLAGLAFDLETIRPSASSSSKTMRDVSFVLKLNLESRNKMLALRPSGAIGYGYIPRFAGYEESDYATIKLYNEIVAISRSQVGVLLDVGALWGKGGNKDFDISRKARLFFRFGIVF